MKHFPGDRPEVLVDKFKRRLIKNIRASGEVYDPQHVPSQIAMRLLWNAMRGREEARQAILIEAGWDTGWLFHNWHQLPPELKADLCHIDPGKTTEILSKARAMTEAEK